MSRKFFQALSPRGFWNFIETVASRGQTRISIGRLKLKSFNGGIATAQQWPRCPRRAGWVSSRPPWYPVTLPQPQHRRHHTAPSSLPQKGGVGLKKLFPRNSTAMKPNGNDSNWPSNVLKARPESGVWVVILGSYVQSSWVPYCTPERRHWAVVKLAFGI